MPEILAATPSGSSARNAMHLCQGTVNFRQFDYGEEENRKRYGSSVPPSYNVANIDVPTYIQYGGRDKVIAPSIIEPVSKKFKKGVLKKVIIHEEFDHIDFVASIESRQRVNDFIFEVIGMFEREQ